MLPDLIWGFSPSSSVPGQSFSLPCCRGVVHFAVQVRSIGWMLWKHPHPLSLPSQWQGTFNPSLKSLSSPWVKLDRRSVGRMGQHQGGEGAREVEQGFRYINPRATVVTHSLTRIHPSSLQTLTHTATSQLVMQLSSVSFSACGWLEINCKRIRQ